MGRKEGSGQQQQGVSSNTDNEKLHEIFKKKCKMMLSFSLNQMNRICTRFICSVAKVQQQGKGKGELKRVDSKYNVLT